MKKYACSLSLLLGSLLSSAQNLVPNGSFEEYTECPTGWGQWTRLEDWTSPYLASADYFNACIENDVAGVPYNQFGYQAAADGQAYVGVATYLLNLPTYREMMSVDLLETLQPGVPVCLSFKMAMGGFGSWEGNSARYTNKGVGMKFFRDQPSDWFSYLFPNAAALSLDEVPLDTSAWYTIAGVYVPDSSYTSLVIANFFTDSSSDVVLFDSSGAGNWNTAYAFIDDVRVSFDLSFCDQANGIAANTEGIPSIYPNPCDGLLNIILPRPTNGQIEVEVFNAIGQQVMSKGFNSSAGYLVVDIESLIPGIYSVHLHDTRGHFATVIVTRYTQ